MNAPTLATETTFDANRTNDTTRFALMPDCDVFIRMGNQSTRPVATNAPRLALVKNYPVTSTIAPTFQLQRPVFNQPRILLLKRNLIRTPTQTVTSEAPSRMTDLNLKFDSTSTYALLSTNVPSNTIPLTFRLLKPNTNIEKPKQNKSNESTTIKQNQQPLDSAGQSTTDNQHKDQDVSNTTLESSLVVHTKETMTPNENQDCEQIKSSDPDSVSAESKNNDSEEVHQPESVPETQSSVERNSVICYNNLHR
ncbi:unnamed protein product [Parnassius apollo]|uniref:(apollo) hypothetical protein n=1 Tax=Parnassius apollo TaxID=110799 RepID=A0A8S3XYR3_PARAO|nr:unnamed protein product [Parnassius apollo]